MEGWLAGAIATWNTGAAGAHLCVLRNGEIVLTCPIEYVAWHAGTDYQTGRTMFWRRNNINQASIGVELEGFHDRGFTNEQFDACRKIALWGEVEYGIPRVHTYDQIEGHHSHSEISNQRGDPGPYFDYARVL